MPTEPKHSCRTLQRKQKPKKKKYGNTTTQIRNAHRAAVTEKNLTGTALNRKILQKLSGQIWTFWPNRAQKLIEI